MHWIHEHHTAIGILAESLTFLGGFLLARDAFLRLGELTKNRIDNRFRVEFPRLNLTDEEWHEAVVSLRWTLAGFVLLVVGFAFQLLLRLVEP
ncbi:MAG TPA: hypothetical protein VMR02_01855 [Terracidiphilus sp.]|jgi:hypothetical protein|nr:hypothetical protein [Terracidiphilus sp.]